MSKEPNNVEVLFRSIHSTPGLREWVTSKSVALAPVPVKRGERWGLISLLAVPTRLEDGSEEFIAPWGAVEWAWPENKVAQTTNLRLKEETASLYNSEVITARPTDRNIILEPSERNNRENTLFQVLDEFLSTPPNSDSNLVSLAGYYAGLLPDEVYSYYWALIPESRTWLRPDVSAPALISPKPSSETLKQDTLVAKKAQQGKLAEPAGSNASTEHAVKEQTEPSQPWQPPTDLTEQIGPWLSRCLKLAEAFSLREVVNELRVLDARRRLPGYRLAFVGEFSRGKSNLINRLLSKPLLPVRVTPTTATLTSIVAGSENRMEVNFSEEHKEVRPLQESSWDDLLATDQIGSTQKVLAEVQLTLDHPWLRAHDVELIDTPGVADPNSHRAALVLDLLSQCDAAVLLISATSPFSMTESVFLEEEVIGRHIPRIIVVVSKLDTLPEEERPRVFAFVRQHVAKISAAIPVLPSYPVDKNTTETEALKAVQTQIEKMGAKSERRAWLSQQVARQLADYLSHLIETGKRAIAAAKMTEAEREQELRKAQAELRNAELHWESIELELDRCRLQLAQELQEKIIYQKTELMENLTFELSRTPDPKTWWELDLPFRLRRELVALSRKSEDFLMTAIANDIKWLQREVARAFATKITPKTSQNQAKPEIVPDFHQVPLTDIRQYRILTRLGSGVALIGGYLLSGPAGIAASIGAGILGDHILTNKLEEQRQLLAQELERSIDKTFDEYCHRVAESFRQLYHQLLEDTKREQAAWLSARNAALKGSSKKIDEPVWQQMIDEVSVLRKEIFTALAQ